MAAAMFARDDNARVMARMLVAFQHAILGICLLDDSSKQQLMSACAQAHQRCSLARRSTFCFHRQLFFFAALIRVCGNAGGLAKNETHLLTPYSRAKMNWLR